MRRVYFLGVISFFALILFSYSLQSQSFIMSSSLSCAAVSQLSANQKSVCGDGKLGASEACDGNLFHDGKACSDVISSFNSGEVGCMGCSLTISECTDSKGCGFSDYIQAITTIESGNNPEAQRYEAQLGIWSIGLGQILTTTAKELEKKYPDLPRLGESFQEINKSLRDPTVNRVYTARLYLDELGYYQDPDLAVAAYNSGHFTPRNARIQQQLNEIMGSSLTTDGALGSQTQEVAKQFQKKYGLTADGKVGPATYKKIQEVWTEKNPGKANQLGIVPINTYTPNHVVKFNSALKEIC